MDDYEPQEPMQSEARTPEQLLQFNILNSRERTIRARETYIRKSRFYKTPPIIDFKASVDSYFMYCRGAFDEKQPEEAQKITLLLRKNDFQSIDDAFRLVDNWFRFIGLVKIDNKQKFNTVMERNKSIFG